MNGKDIFRGLQYIGDDLIETRKPDSSPPRIRKVGRRTVPSAVRC